jgi:hypothetical protein
MEVLIMDLTILAKKISSYRTPAGRVTKLPDEILGEILQAWEQWTGTASDFYRALGSHQKKMAKIMGKAKQLKREGAFDGINFTEVVVEDEKVDLTSIPVAMGACGIELIWKDNIIRFGNSELLVDFLKKAA